MNQVTLEPWQKSSLSKFIQQKKLYLEWDVGTGKTFLFAYIIKYIQKFYPKMNILMICPPPVFPSVRSSFKDNGITEFNLLDTTKERDNFCMFPQNRTKVCVISQQSFITDRFCKLLGKTMVSGVMVDYSPGMIIVDEAHLLNGEKSQTSKKIKAYFDEIGPKYRIMGSGTPIGNSELEFYHSMYCLDKTVLAHSFEGFRQKYFFNATENRGYNTFKLSDHMREEFYKKIAPLKTTLTIRDTFKELPERNYIKRNFDMYEEQKQVYNDLKEKFVVEFKEKEEKLKEDIKKDPAKRSNLKFQFYQHVLSQMSALRQVCNGFVYESIPEDIKQDELRGFLKTRKVMNFPTPKTDALRAGLSKITKDKILIWSVFIESFNQIEKVLYDLNLKYVRITGSTPVHKRPYLIQTFKEDPDCRIFLSHPKSGGVGLNLPEAKYSIFYSQDFSFISKAQAEGRNHRINSIEFNKNIFYFEFLIKNSIETYIKNKITSKKKMADDFKNYLLH